MAESKQCVVFGVQLMKPSSGFDGLSWYGFDSSFSPVEALEGGYDSEDDCGYDFGAIFDLDAYYEVKLDDDSSIAKPLATLSGVRFGSTIGCWKDCLFRVGGNHYTEQKKRKIEEYSKKIKDSDPRWERFRMCTNRVDYWSPAEQECKWKLHSRLKQSRSGCKLLVLGQLMYVAGGASNFNFKNTDKAKKEASLIFMEVFNSEKRRWVAVANPPEDSHLMDELSVCAAWEGGGKLLFASMACTHFYAYKPASCSWERCDHLRFVKSALGSSTRHPGVVVGDHCLWLNWDLRGNFLIGLDLVKGRYFCINLAFERLLPKPSFKIYTPLLLHLRDGKLCLLWRDNTLYRVCSDEEEEESSSSSSDEDDDDDDSEEKEVDDDDSEEKEVYDDDSKEKEVTDNLFEEGEEEEEEEEESRMKKNEKDGWENYGGYRCNEFVIDFRRAYKKGSLKKANSYRPKATGCVTVKSRRKLIAPSLYHQLWHAFVMNVAVYKGTSGDQGKSESEAFPAMEVVASERELQAGAYPVLRPCKERRPNKRIKV